MTSEPQVPPKPPALAGIRVLDFSVVVAGPFCGRMLADAGAEVIKIEPPPAGDPSRNMMFIKQGLSGYFVQHNAGKKSLCLDLKTPQAVEIVKRLVPTADIVLENFRPGVMGRLGLGYETLCRINPRLIYCSISGFGQTGPNRDQRAFAGVVHAASGEADIVRRAHGAEIPPGSLGMSFADTYTGLYAFGAINLALYHREVSGKGQWIDLALFDAIFCSIDFQVQYYTMSGQEPPDSFGARPFKGTGGYLTIGIGAPAPVRRALKVVCPEEHASLFETYFSTGEKLAQHYQRFQELVEAWLQQFDDVEEPERILRQAGVAVSKVRRVSEAVHSPQVKARHLLVDVDDPRIGPIKVMNSPLRFSEIETKLQGPAPSLGEHNQEILTRVLGYAEREVTELERCGVLYRESMERYRAP
jgi:crotonobetainyl-CoA:carnitine CoA-transferase CaiB-like acyl-CoA transferase